MRSKQLLQPVVLNQPGVVLIILLVLLLLSFRTTTTKKLTKKLTKKKMKKGVFYSWFGNVMLLLCSMIAVVEGYSPLPNGNGEHLPADRTGNTLNRIVDDWMDTNKRPGIEAIYGPIGDWDVSSVKNFKHLFYNKNTFNADISKWNVADATNMHSSES